MKKYKLLQWYPAIPKWLEAGDTVENTRDSPDCYFAIYKGAGDGFCQLITNKKKEVENNPEFWGEVEEITMSEEMTNSWLVSQLMHAYLDCTNNQTDPNIFLDLKEKVVNRMDNELKLSDLVEAESIAREKMPIKVKWEVKEKNSMTTVPQWIIEAMLEFASPS